MNTKATKERKLLLSLAAVLLVTALLAAPAAEATRYLPNALATLQMSAAPGFDDVDQVDADAFWLFAENDVERLTILSALDAPEIKQLTAENRIRLFPYLAAIPRPVELAAISKLASGVSTCAGGLNVWETGGLAQDCGSPSFQGLWTDPTTGIAYARNRWYDARNASWLSEDPKGAVDSVNLYAFVGWGPHMGTDPMGLKTDYDYPASTARPQPWAPNPNVPHNDNSVPLAVAGALTGISDTLVVAPAQFIYTGLAAGLYDLTSAEMFFDEAVAWDYMREPLRAGLQSPSAAFNMFKEAFLECSRDYNAAVDRGDYFGAARAYGRAGAILLALRGTVKVPTKTTGPTFAPAHAVTTSGRTLSQAVEGGAVVTGDVGLPAGWMVSQAKGEGDVEVQLDPYNQGLGHHVPAKAAFRGHPKYLWRKVLAVSIAEMGRLGINHPTVSGAQNTLYRQFARTSESISWGIIGSIERQALRLGGADANVAAAIVDQTIAALKADGVTPTRIPWGG